MSVLLPIQEKIDYVTQKAASYNELLKELLLNEPSSAMT